MQLLQDTFIIEQLQILSEGKDNGPMKIRGVFGRCNEKNNNGRIYPTAVLESQLAKVKPLIAERRLCGELDHPANDTVKLSNASHLITKLDMKGDELIGEAEILRTPAGLTAKALVEGGVKIGISSRGMGTLSEDHNGDKIVNEDFRLVTFDLVADPSTRGAYPGMCESVESKFVKDSQSKLTKESNFVTMLNSKMRDAYKPFIEEAMDDFDRATLRADDEAKRTGGKPKYPKWKGPTSKQIDQGEVIDTSTPEGKKKVAELEAKTKTKKKNIAAEAFELVKADGHWHRIADAIAEGYGKKKIEEAFDDEVEAEGKRALSKGTPSPDTGGMMSNWRARRQAKGMEVATSKGRVKGMDIEQKGQIKRGRRMEKAKAAAAAGGPVTTGEKVAAGAGKMATGAKDLAKGAAALPGKTIDTAVAVSTAATKAKHADRLARAERRRARGRSAKRKTERETPAPTKDYKPNEEQPFGAGANKPKEREDQARAYKQIGSMLAEMFNLKEETKKEIAADIARDKKYADAADAAKKAGKRPVRQVSRKPKGRVFPLGQYSQKSDNEER